MRSTTTSAAQFLRNFCQHHHHHHVYLKQLGPRHTHRTMWQNTSAHMIKINCFSERSMLRDSVYFTTLKSLDYNVVMTFRFNNNNNNIIQYVKQHIHSSITAQA